MITLVLATHNSHKVREIQQILKKAHLKVKILTLEAFPKFPPVVENLETIRGNAAKKAREVAKRTGHWALADDTGLFIKALQGRPGVYSARFAGPNCTFADNNRKVLRLMKNVPPKNRQASFRCVAALASPKGKVVSVEGRIDGLISEKPKGSSGFGYDPIFLVPHLKKTFAELSPNIKNRISHRANAFTQVPDLLHKLLKASR
ncbi:MAG: dITP/XTP pyrophosphatase [Elusimicrobia bacterium]|nr:dITP/XTP pyrophosphatase [Elusimicrobiota bacterium]